MINSSFALEISSLYYYYFGEKKGNTKISPITLQLLENESQNIQMNTLPIDYISCHLHNIYKKVDVQLKAAILRIICNLEINSDVPLIVKYRFDDMVCESLQREIPEQRGKSEDEKVSAFKYVSFLIQGKQILPESILRSLIYLFYTSKNMYNRLIISLIAKGILLCENFPDVPEVANILVDTALAKQDPDLVDLFGYIFERQCNRPLQKWVSYKLIAPFSNISCKKPELDNATKIIIDLLRTWPGIFCLGLDNGAISDFFRSLKKITPNALKILTELLLIEGPPKSISDTYSGFLFYTLLQNGILDKLDEISTKSNECVKVINMLQQYAPYAYCSAKANPGMSKISIDYLATEKVVDVMSQNLSNSPLPTQISSYVLPSDHKQWDWETIRSFLTLILPSNPFDATNGAIPFYHSLLDYYGSTFLFDTNASYCPVISQCIDPLLDVLLKKSYNLDYVFYERNNHNLPIAIMGSFQKVFKFSENSTMGEYHPAWSIIKLFMRLLTDQTGFEILIKWNTYAEIKKFIDKNINDLIPKYAKKLISLISFSNAAEAFFMSFMNSDNIEIIEIAMDELFTRSKSVSVAQKEKAYFYLIQCIKKLHPQKKTSSMNIALNLLCKLMLGSQDCVKIVAKDNDLLEIIRSCSHEMYSIVFSIYGSESSLQIKGFSPLTKCASVGSPRRESTSAKAGNLIASQMTSASTQNSIEVPSFSLVDNEISYWMDTGIFKYVTVYDQAISMTFRSENKTVPSIIMAGKFAMIPPHLFGQLNKTEEGLKKLNGCLPRLMHLLGSNHISKRRAALFALGHMGSVPNGTSKEIVGKMIESVKESSSYLLRGTLLSAFSMMNPSQEISNFLYDCGFQLFKFGPHSAVVPIERSTMLIQSSQQPSEISDMKPFNCPKTPFAIRVINCLPVGGKVKSPEKELYNYCTAKRNEIMTHENAQFLHNFLSTFPVSVPLRKYLVSLFNEMPPLIVPIGEKVEMKTYQISYAKIYESSLLNQIPQDDNTLQALKFPQIPIAQLKNVRPDSPCPEVYLSNEDLRAATSYDLDSFYRLPINQILSYREMLKRM